MGKTLDKLSKQGKAFVASVGLLGMIGCQNLPPQGQAFIRDMGYNAIQTGISEGIRGQLNPSAYPNNVQQNVYVQEQQAQQRQYQPQEIQQPVKLRINLEESMIFFTYNYFKDFNGDGIIEYPVEYVGIKNKFQKDENLRISVLSNYMDRINEAIETKTPTYVSPSSYFGNTSLSVEVYSPHGERVCEFNKIYSLSKGEAMFTSSLMPFLLEKGGLGSYKSVLKINNNFVKTYEFEIIE